VELTQGAAEPNQESKGCLPTCAPEGISPRPAVSRAAKPWEEQGFRQRAEALCAGEKVRFCVSGADERMGLCLGCRARLQPHEHASPVRLTRRVGDVNRKFHRGAIPRQSKKLVLSDGESYCFEKNSESYCFE
jgi:hypothetical protein